VTSCPSGTYVIWRASILLLALLSAGCRDDSDGPESTGLQPAVSRNLPVVKEQVAELPGYNVYRPADLGATGAPLPVITWANGGCYRWDATWTILLEGWARAGFLVVAITAPAVGDPASASRTTAADQAAVIDWAYAENSRAGSPFAGHLDLDRVVAAGNSCGGITALNLASMDKRVNAVFVLSGSSSIPGSPEAAAAAVMGNIAVPVGYVVGGPEDIASIYARQDYELMPVGVPGYRAHRFEADHVRVSTNPDILREVAEISTNWIDFALYRDPQVMQSVLENPCAQCPPGNWTVEAKNLETIVNR